VRVTGALLTCLCLIVALAIIWLGYMVTFEESRFPFESTPREGWDYWIQKEYWRDMRAMALVLLFAVSSVGLPFAATWRAGLRSGKNRIADRTLLAIAALYGCFLLALTWTYLTSSGRGLLIFAILWMGEIYAVVIFSIRARRPIGTAG
jgi:hypothetical protein